MPRIRTLKPEHKVHRKVGPLSHLAYRLWVGMITESDDEGRLVGDLAQLRALIFPYHPMPPSKIEGALTDLAGVGLVQRYVCQGIPYIAFPSWKDHQHWDGHHCKTSKLPQPPTFTKQSLNGDYVESTRSLTGDDIPRTKDQGSRTKGRPEQGPGIAGDSVADSVESPARPGVVFQIPESIRSALSRTPRLAESPRLTRPDFWQAQIRARPEVDFPAELLKAEAWIAANPKKAPKSNMPAFLQRWFAKTAEQLEDTHG